MLISNKTELSLIKNHPKETSFYNSDEMIFSSYTYQVQLKEDELLERIKEIEGLEEDWDGYRACKIDSNAIKTSKILIGPPFVSL